MQDTTRYYILTYVIAILATGGAGFIGSHIAEALSERGQNVLPIIGWTPYYDMRTKYHNLEGYRETDGNRFKYADSVIADHDIDVAYH